MHSTQATVKHFDPRTRSGSVVFDDGRELTFDAAAFDRGGLLKLRLGQRVRLALGSDPDPDAAELSQPAIAALTIVTMAFPPGVGSSTDG